MEYLDKLLGVSLQPFDPTQPKFDQTTFYGRFRAIFDAINPSALCYSREQAAEAKAILDTYDPAQTLRSDKELWHAKWLAEATYHPTTSWPVPLGFRLAAIIPAKIPILFGMLFSPKTSFSISFWQIVNQTYNVSFIYCNRGIHSPVSDHQLYLSYLAGIGSSVTIAKSVDKWIVRRSQHTLVIRTFGPFLASAASGLISLLIFSYHELLKGVKVYDRQGNYVGVSRLAAREAFGKSWTVHVLSQVSVLFGPVIIKVALQRLHLFPAARPLKLLTEVGIIAGSLGLFWPLCFAIYPYKHKLEAELATSDELNCYRPLRPS